MTERLKVGIAAILGMATPGTNLFLDGIEPVLKILLLLGQIAVAVTTTWYIYRKAKNLSKK